MKNFKKIAIVLIVVSMLFCFASCDNKPAEKYTVTFETYGGTTINPIETSYLKTLPIPAKQGFYFDGWYYNPSFTGNKAIINSNICNDTTLYAKFIEGIYEYTINNDNTSVTITGFKYCPLDKNLVIPNKITDNGKTYDVTNIDIVAIDKPLSYVESFKVESDIKITHLPIAFEKAKTVDLSKLSSLNNVSITCNNLETLVLPNVENIPSNFLLQAFKLKTLVLPNTIKTIERQAFINCYFENINIPSSVEKIGNDAFYNCINLENINLLSNNMVELNTNGIYNITVVKKLNASGEVIEVPVKINVKTEELKTQYLAKYTNTKKFNFAVSK